MAAENTGPELYDTPHVAASLSTLLAWKSTATNIRSFVFSVAFA
jgi:hypothetical protein